MITADGGRLRSAPEPRRPIRTELPDRLSQDNPCLTGVVGRGCDSPGLRGESAREGVTAFCASKPIFGGSYPRDKSPGRLKR